MQTVMDGSGSLDHSQLGSCASPKQEPGNEANGIVCAITLPFMVMLTEYVYSWRVSTDLGHNQFTGFYLWYFLLML